MNEEKKYYNKFVLKGSLSLEGYQDDMHWHNVFDEGKDKAIDNCFELLNTLNRRVREVSNSEELIIRKKEYEELNKIFNYLGKEHFTYYEDGDVEYNYDIYDREG
jgi:hypothetical protein